MPENGPKGDAMPVSGRDSAQDYRRVAPGPMTVAEAFKIAADEVQACVREGIEPGDSRSNLILVDHAVMGEIERLREALRPFVDEAALGHHEWGKWVPTPPDDEVEVWVTAADMRRAADALGVNPEASNHAA